MSSHSSTKKSSRGSEVAPRTVSEPGQNQCAWNIWPLLSSHMAVTLRGEGARVMGHQERAELLLSLAGAPESSDSNTAKQLGFSNWERQLSPHTSTPAGAETCPLHHHGTDLAR